MKVIKKKISVLGVKYDSQWRSIDINFGSVVFHLFKGQIMIDETPYYDEHLVPIKNLTINEKFFSFDSFYKKNKILTLKCIILILTLLFLLLSILNI